MQMQDITYIDLGCKDYKETWDLQQKIHQKLVRKKESKRDMDTCPCLIFVEHPHVYTLGKSGKELNLLIQPDFLQKIQASLFRIDRGGDITYHGPGQLVGYPILNLGSMHLGIKKYIYGMEEAVMLSLKHFGLFCTRIEGSTGVWLPAGNKEPLRKICAIGVKVSHGITMHGFALNVTTDLTYFNYINPCGFTDKSVTSMEKELPALPSMPEVKEEVKKNLSAVFGLRFL
jgi:lipoyl(octanoyl) transferase